MNYDLPIPRSPSLSSTMALAAAATSREEQTSTTATPDSVPSRATKNLEAAAGTRTVGQSSDSVVADRADDSGDEYQPGDQEVEGDHEDENSLDTPEDAHRITHRAMLMMSREEKQRHADDQVGFIILKRDNNQPDPFGALSETYGPLPWPGVAKAYNERYNAAVGAAAMEKRARQHRVAWVSRHPTYPVQIVYSKKPKAQPVRRAKNAATQAPANCLKDDVNKQEVRPLNVVSPVDEVQTCTEPTEVSNSRIGGWVPPDAIRNQADLNNYIDHYAAVENEKVVLELYDTHGSPSETIIADREGLISSSVVLQKLMESNERTEVELQCSSLELVKWYVQCVASEKLTEAPKCSSRESISLMELYCFATQFQDDHVRGLILARWRCLAEKDAEMGVSVEDLTLLFESTGSEDEARNFWIKITRKAELGHKLVEMGACNSELIAATQSEVP
jgi:hypothetical protein